MKPELENLLQEVYFTVKIKQLPKELIYLHAIAFVCFIIDIGFGLTMILADIELTQFGLYMMMLDLILNILLTIIMCCLWIYSFFKRKLYFT
jgi:hypothetical protein